MALSHLKGLMHTPEFDPNLMPETVTVGKTVGSVVFTRSGARAPEQLETIKKYNSGSFYTDYEWDKPTHRWRVLGGDWTLNPVVPNETDDYTNRVMREVE